MQAIGKGFMIHGVCFIKNPAVSNPKSSPPQPENNETILGLSFPFSICVSVLGSFGFGAANAYAMMVFCLLYTPCVATIAVIQREMKSYRIPILSYILG